MINEILIVAGIMLGVVVVVWGLKRCIWWMFGIDKIVELLEKIKDEA